MTFNVTHLFAEARRISREKHAEGETAKRGNLRVGTSGIVSPTGEVAGSCIRKAHIRQLGIEMETLTEDKLLMFDLGFANEDVVYNKLVSSLPAGHVILREEEIPVEWMTANGTKVTGRPDIVICTETDVGGNIGVRPVLGIELKSVHSLWTARDVLFEGKPKLSNLIQAAHYMWLLNVPYKLIYTAYSQLGQGMAGTSDGWIVKMLPRPGEKNSEYIEYTYYKKVTKEIKGKQKEVNSKIERAEWDSLPWQKRDYSIKHVGQFDVIYDMRFSDEGVVQFKHESKQEWKDTIITRKGIEAFFNRTAEIATTGDLGPRPTAVDAVGNKANYSDCSYCKAKDTCDRTEKLGYSKWLEEVRKLDVSKVSGK